MKCDLQPMKHDTLQYKSSFYAAGCTLDESGDVMRLGYIFVDMLKLPQIIVIAGTGETYKIKIPKEMLNIPSSHQFNYSVEIIKE